MSIRQVCKVRLALQRAVPKKLVFHFSASSVSSGDPPAFVGNSSFSLMGGVIVISELCSSAKVGSVAKVVASVVWLMLIVASSGCDAINSVNTDNAAESVPAPVAAAAVTPPPSPAEVPMPPAPIMRTPKEIIDEILAMPSIEWRDEHLTQLAGLTEGLDAVTKLDLTRSGVSDEGMKTLTAFPQLAELNLAETRVTSTGLASVAQATSLKSLTLVNLRQVDDNGIKHLASLKGLESLTIAACPVSDAIFATLAEMEELQKLDLSSTPNIYGKGAILPTNKRGFRNLRELRVSGTKFGYFGFEQLSKLPQLEVLMADRCEAAGPVIMGLTGCEELKVLDLSGNSLLDDNLKVLSRLKNLEELRLSQINALTGTCLHSIKTLKQLKLLDLEGTRVTQPEIEILKKMFLKDTKILAVGQTF